MYPRHSSNTKYMIIFWNPSYSLLGNSLNCSCVISFNFEVGNTVLLWTMGGFSFFPKMLITALTKGAIVLCQCFPTFFKRGTLTWHHSTDGTMHFWHSLYILHLHNVQLMQPNKVVSCLAQCPQRQKYDAGQLWNSGRKLMNKNKDSYHHWSIYGRLWDHTSKWIFPVKNLTCMKISPNSMQNPRNP